MAYVAVFMPGAQPQRVELRETNIFGRSSSCDVWVNDRNASRQHCKLQHDGEKWMLIDLDSTNGTWLDAARVRRYALRDGETFYIGDCRIVFHADQFIENRPVDPNEASHFAEMLPPEEDTNAETVIGIGVKRRLPTAAATVVKPGWSRAVRAQNAAKSVAFKRPPARPIVTDHRSGGWVGTLVSRLRGQ